MIKKIIPALIILIIQTNITAKIFLTGVDKRIDESVKCADIHYKLTINQQCPRYIDIIRVIATTFKCEDKIILRDSEVINSGKVQFRVLN